MIIECSTCHARYQYDEARFEGKPSKKIKCAKCQNIFEIRHPSSPARRSPEDQTAAKHEAQGDRTHIGKIKKPVEETTEAEIPHGPDTNKHLAALSMPEGKRLSLAIIDGPNSGSVFRIEKPNVTLGRAGADFVLDDTESSRKHASVEIRDGLYMLNDLQSTNGTLVDGQKIDGPTEIQNHSEFQIGSTVLMLIVTDAT